MVSPLSNGLFHRAIAQSDPFAIPWPYMASMHRAGTEPAERFGSRWAADRGLANATSAQLRAVPYEQTLPNPATAIAEGVTPMIDGRILPERGPEAFAAGRAKHLPYIIGGNSYEGALAMLYKARPADRVAELGAQGPAILDLYDTKIRNNPDLLGATIMGDGGFLAPRRWAARAAAARGTPTWVYHFGYVLEQMRGSMPGAPHGMETPFVFDGFKSLRMRPSAKDEATATVMHAYWVNFARTGDPNGPGLPTWPQFVPGTETLLSFDNDGQRAINGFNDALYDLYDERLRDQRRAH
jgi:para-nitrobenzyl esterase